MTDNDIKTISEKIESLHKKILESKFAEKVAESEMMSLILAVQTINSQKAEIEMLKEQRDEIHEDVLIAEEYAWNLRKKLKTAKSEAYKEFAERLCKDRVSNDPVVIAVKVELEELTEGGNEDG